MQAEQSREPDNSEPGWYLYGITWREQAASLAGALAEETGEPMQVLELGALGAVIKPVPVEAFTAETLREQAEDLAWLETMARRHHQVVARIHQAAPVLPARFGSVYPSREALRIALAERHDALLAQIQQYEGCDEWGVHLYADRQAAQQLASALPALQQLTSEIAAASPGRAYLLKRKMADELAALTEQALERLAQASYAQLARVARHGKLATRSERVLEGAGEREVLHALLLVEREKQAAFLESIQQLADAQPGLRCAYSGPWPPYSFVDSRAEEAP